MNTKTIAKNIAKSNYQKYFDGRSLFHYTAMIDGMYSNLDFLKLFENRIFYWKDVLISSKIPVKILFDNFREKLINDWTLMDAVEDYRRYLNSDLKDYDTLYNYKSGKRIIEFTNEYDKYCKENCI